MGGVHYVYAYPNGPARMGGVQPKRKRKARQTNSQSQPAASSQHRRQVTDGDPEATLHGRSGRTYNVDRSEATVVDAVPPPPYTR